MRLLFVALAVALAMTGAGSPVAAEERKSEEPTRATRLPLLAPIDREPAPARDHLELPWLWRHIRTAIRKTEQALPSHRTDRFYILFTPVRVSNGFDTVAGLGIEGSF